MAHRRRVVRSDRNSFLQQRLDEGKRRRLSHVVGPCLERQAPERHPPAPELVIQRTAELLQQHSFLPLVGRFNCRQYIQFDPALASHLDQRLDILGEARPSVPGAREQKRLSDAGIASDPLPHEIDICAQLVAQIGDLVHEGDPRSEHPVRRVLSHLGRGDVHQQDRLPGADKGSVELGHHSPCVGRLDAQDHAVGSHEVFDRCSFFQELRVAADMKRKLGFARDSLGDPGRAADRDGRFSDDHSLPRHVPADECRHFEDVLQICGSIFARRCANRDDHDFCRRNRVRQVGGEREPALFLISLDQRIQPGLINRHVTLLQSRDLLAIDVDAADSVAGFSETGADY